MSQNLSLNKEPKFCFCIPLAKGVCCGLLSLKTILLLMTVIDIGIEGTTIGFGVTIFLRYTVPYALIAYLILNVLSFFLDLICLFAIVKTNLMIIRYYFVWKCIEVLIIPIFELIILFTSYADYT